MYRKFIRRNREVLGDFFISTTNDLIHKLCDDFEKYVQADIQSREFSGKVEQSLRHLQGHFDNDRKWAAINRKIWNLIKENEQNILFLSDFDKITSELDCEYEDVLAVVGLLSASSVHLLRLEYVETNSGYEIEVSAEKVSNELRKWWREKTISSEKWRKWASSIRVQWRLSEIKEAKD